MASFFHQAPHQATPRPRTPSMAMNPATPAVQPATPAAQQGLIPPPQVPLPKLNMLSIQEYHQDCDISVNASVDIFNAQILANLRLDTPGQTPGSNGEVDDKIALRQDGKKDNVLLNREYGLWLKSMPTWEHGLGDGWEGTAILGRGGFGIAGLWTYQGKGAVNTVSSALSIVGMRTQPPSVPAVGFQVVVKQQRAGLDGGAEEEAKIHQMLNRTKSEHFPLLYKRVYREPGSGVPGMLIDSNRREVHRMFMEFCSGGDMHDLIVRCRKQGPQRNNWRFLREDHVWSIFDCFARAFFAMEAGEEDPNEEQEPPAWEGTGLVHFDLKPGNVFVGLKDENLHTDIAVHKIGDFGLAYVMPEAKDQDRDTMRSARGRGTRHTLAPEQMRYSKYRDGVDPEGNVRYSLNDQLPLELRKYGPWTNIYQIGCCMYMLMTVTTHFPYKWCTFHSRLKHPDLRQGETIGEDLELGIFPPDANRYHRGPNEGETIRSGDGKLPERIPTPYSQALTSLVLRCLMQDYQHRPTLDDLREEIRDNWDTALTTFATEQPNNSSWADVGSQQDFKNGSGDDVLPASWNTAEPDGYWARASKRIDAVHRPLSEILRRQAKDAARKRQVLKARLFLGWAEGATRAPETPGPPKASSPGNAKPAARRGHSEVEPDSSAESIAHRAKRIAAQTRQQLPTFVLTVRLFNTEHLPAVLISQDSRTIEYACKIGLFKQQLCNEANFPFPIETVRVARPDAVHGSMWYHLADDVALGVAACPAGTPVGMLDVFGTIPEVSVVLDTVIANAP